MDPNPLTPADWETTSNILRYVWIMLVMAFGFAASLVLAHAMIPSLLDSGHVPERLRERMRKLRFPFYLVALGFLAGFAFWLNEVTDLAHDIGRFWPRYFF